MDMVYETIATSDTAIIFWHYQSQLANRLDYRAK